jgi:D-amino peptidase
MRPRRALLVVDLEGVAGVDTLPSLVAGTPEYPRSRELLTAEVLAAVEGLLAAGFSHVRISDSHMSGSGEPNVLADSLPPGAELRFEEDWYSASVFAGVHAVACLGMHAPGGSPGFAAHTVDLLGAWSCAGRLLSEADLVLGLAAEAGIPAVFVAGDEALEQHLAGRVPYVRTKQSLSAARAASRSPEEVRAALSHAARQPPVHLEPLPAAPLRLAFKSTHQATLAAAEGARRVGRYHVEVEGGSFRERYSRAFTAVGAASAAFAEAVRGEPGQHEFTEDVRGALLAPGPREVPAPSRLEQATRALHAFLRLTEDSGDESRALRALTLHMLEGHAPTLFARWQLGPTLEQAVAALAEVPHALPLELEPDVGMARLDALYVRRERGLKHPAPLPAALRHYLEHLHASEAPLYAWLVGELGAACGVDVRLYYPERPLRGEWRLGDLYWLTHLYLLETRYLRTPLQHERAAVWTEELLLAVPWLLSERQADLGGEVALCLQLAGEHEGGAHEALLELVVQHQQEEGQVLDQRMAEAGADAAHATAVALLVLAGAEERRASSPHGPQSAPPRGLEGGPKPEKLHGTNLLW